MSLRRRAFVSSPTVVGRTTTAPGPRRSLVTRTGGPGFSVNYATANGTATTTGNDYVAKSASSALADGRHSRPCLSPSRATHHIEIERNLFPQSLQRHQTASRSADAQARQILNARSGSLSINDVSITEGQQRTTTPDLYFTRAGGNASLQDPLRNRHSRRRRPTTIIPGPPGRSVSLPASPRDISVIIKGDTKIEPTRPSRHLSNATNGPRSSTARALDHSQRRWDSPFFQPCAQRYRFRHAI